MELKLKEFKDKYLSPIKGDECYWTGFAIDWKCEFEYKEERWEWASWDRDFKVYAFHKVENGKSKSIGTTNDDELVLIKPF